MIIPGDDRPEGVYIAGNPGNGKSSLIQQMALHDIESGHGVCVIDPTRDLVNTLIHWIPRERVSDTIYFDTDHPLPLDLFSYRNPQERRVLTDQLVNLFALDAAPISKPRLQKIIGTLFDANERGGNFTFLDIQTFIEDKTTRDKVFQSAPHREQQWTPFPKLAEFSSIFERMTPFTESPNLRTMFSPAKDRLNIWDIMQGRKILLVNLRDTPTDLFIGSLIAAKFQQATFGRDFIPESGRTPYYLYIDECHTVMKFCEPEFEQILTRARKYKLCLTMANQIPDDLPPGIRQKIGTIATIILFNLDPKDALIFKGRIKPYDIDQLTQLVKFQAICRVHGEVRQITTPHFLGYSPDSYAESIRKRTVDNTPSQASQDMLELEDEGPTLLPDRRKTEDT